MTQVLMSQLVEGDDINSRLGAARKEGIVQLAASIKEVGLILPLAVRALPLTYSSPEHGPAYEIVDGHRRFAALKKLKWAEPVPVNVIVGDARAQSLVANIERLPLHPVDQYEAITRLTDEGWSTDRVMKTFNLTDLQVKRILRLAGMSDKVRKAWKDDKLNATEAQAFAISNDHKAQDAALKEVLKATYRPAAYEIKKLVTNGARAVGKGIEFVTVERYTAAGGQVIEDLFAEKEEHRFLVSDDELLQKLIGQKLLEVITDLNAEGLDVREEFDEDTYEYEELLDPPDWDGKSDALAYLRSIPKEKRDGCTWVMGWGYGGLRVEGPFRMTEYRDAEPGAADEDDATDEGYVAPAPREPVEAKEPDGLTAALRADVIGWRRAAFVGAFAGDGKAFLRVMLHAATTYHFSGLMFSAGHEVRAIDVWQFDSSLVMADEMASAYAKCIDAGGDKAAETLAFLLADTKRLRQCLLDVFREHAEEYFERCNMATIRKDLADMGADPLGNDAKKAALAKHAAKKAVEKEWLPALLRVGLGGMEPNVHGLGPDGDLDAAHAAMRAAAASDYDHADLA
jgi:ParB/RepB/Spo0J family partition protein